MSEELKPCPFCGSEVEVQTSEAFQERVKCPTCVARTLWGETARERWNKRMRKRLTECPICGWRGRVHTTYNGKYCVQCEKCGLTIGSSKIESDVIAAWNRRLSDDKGETN